MLLKNTGRDPGEGWSPELLWLQLSCVKQRASPQLVQLHGA